MRLKKYLAVMAAGAMLLGGCSGSSSEKETATAAKTETAAESKEAESTAPETTAVETTSEAEPEDKGGFKVEGTKLLDANGNEFVMRGINEAHSWYKDQDGVSLKAISEAGCNCVRIVCGSGQKYSADAVYTLKTLINVCKNLNMVAILEAHDGTGDNSIEMLEDIADYWISVKDAYVGQEEYVILNIANEWYGNWSGIGTWAEGYETVIPKLREAGIENTIMVDAAGWGQYADSIAEYGQEVFDSDPLKNTMFSVHMYGSAGKNEKTIRKAIEGATDEGLCICVGEFGYRHSDGDVDEAYIMQYCTENDIGYLGWSWKGNGGGVEYLDISNDWEGKNLSPDWGEVLINGEYGIKNTSKICSIFE